MTKEAPCALLVTLGVSFPPWPPAFRSIISCSCSYCPLSLGCSSVLFASSSVVSKQFFSSYTYTSVSVSADPPSSHQEVSLLLLPLNLSWLHSFDQKHCEPPRARFLGWNIKWVSLAFFLGGAHPQHMEVPRLGVQLEL